LSSKLESRILTNLEASHSRLYRAWAKRDWQRHRPVATMLVSICPWERKPLRTHTSADVFNWSSET